MDLTIAICSYQREKPLARLLDSIAHAVQSLSLEDCVEVFICVDGSTDGTAQYLDQLSSRFPTALRYQWQENKGLATARNMCLENVTSRRIWFLDDDMIVSPKALDSHFHADVHCSSSSATTLFVGPCEIPRRPDTESEGVRVYYENRHRRLSALGRITNPTDFSCANTSGYSDFFRTIGFDQQFVRYGYEDFDFAKRAMDDHVEIIFLSVAGVQHEHHIDKNDVLRITRDMGFNRVFFHSKHDDISVASLPGHPDFGNDETLFRYFAFKPAAEPLWFLAKLLSKFSSYRKNQRGEARLWNMAQISAAYSGIAAAGGRHLYMQLKNENQS